MDAASPLIFFICLLLSISASLAFPSLYTSLYFPLFDSLSFFLFSVLCLPLLPSLSFYTFFCLFPFFSISRPFVPCQFSNVTPLSLISSFALCGCHLLTSRRSRSFLPSLFFFQVSFALHPNGSEIVTASRSFLLRHWDIKSGECKRATKAHDHTVLCMAYDG